MLISSLNSLAKIRRLQISVWCTPWLTTAATCLSFGASDTDWIQNKFSDAFLRNKILPECNIKIFSIA